MEEKKESKNYLLLAASLLVVGLIINLLQRKFLNYQMNVIYKTIIVMILVAGGYSFAAGIIAPFARHSLKTIQNPFIKLFGQLPGKVIFYLAIYAILFVLYLVVFVYGMSISSVPTVFNAPNITA